MKKSPESATMEIVRNNLDQDVTIDGYVWYHIDTAYGADADGGRGCKKTIIDDVTDVIAEDELGESIELTKEEQDKAMVILGNKFMEN